jgi:hypothetical protein
MSAYNPIVMTGNGVSAPIVIGFPLDIFYQVAPCYALSLLLNLSPGAQMSCTVELTGDPQPSATGNWNSHDQIQNATSSMNSNVMLVRV